MAASKALVTLGKVRLQYERPARRLPINLVVSPPLDAEGLRPLRFERRGPGVYRALHDGLALAALPPRPAADLDGAPRPRSGRPTPPGAGWATAGMDPHGTGGARGGTSGSDFRRRSAGVPSPPDPSAKMWLRPPDSLLPRRAPPTLPSQSQTRQLTSASAGAPRLDDTTRGVPCAPRRAGARHAPTPSRS